MITKQRSWQFPKQVWIVSVATLFNRSVGFLALFAALFFNSLQLSASFVALALFVLGVVGVAGSVAGGWLAARIGSVPVLIAGSLLNVPLLVLLGLSTSTVLSVVLAAASVGASQAFVAPSATLVTASSYQGDTVTVFAFYRIFINVGSIIAPAIAGVVGFGDFTPLFFASAAGSFLMFALLVATRGLFENRVPDAANAADAESDAVAGAEDGNVPKLSFSSYRTARLWTIVAVFGIAIAIYAQHQSGIPLSVERLPDGGRLFAVLLLINPIVIICCELPLSLLTARMKGFHAFALGVFATGLGLVVCGFGDNWYVCIAGFVVFSLGEAIFAPMGNSLIADMSSAEENAKYQGYLSGAQSVGLAVGPAVGASGVLFDRELFWVLVIVVAVLASLASFLAGKERSGSASI